MLVIDESLIGRKIRFTTNSFEQCPKGFITEIYRISPDRFYVKDENGTEFYLFPHELMNLFVFIDMSNLDIEIAELGTLGYRNEY